MDPFALTSSVLASIKGAGNIAKSALDLKSAADNVELKEHLVNLREALVEAKDSILEVRESLQEKDTKIKGLEERLEKQKSLKFISKYGLYEDTENDDNIKYCGKCYTDGKYVPVQEMPYAFVCKYCNQDYPKPSTECPQFKRPKRSLY